MIRPGIIVGSADYARERLLKARPGEERRGGREKNEERERGREGGERERGRKREVIVRYSAKSGYRIRER